MSMKYEIQSIKNALGKGEEHPFAHIFSGKAMTDEAIETRIQNNCSLTKGDVRGALAALGELIADELAQGNRFHIPEVGYFSLSATLRAPEGTPAEKIRGNHIGVRNINFRPEASLLRRVRKGVRFERTDSSSTSTRYSEEELLAAVRKYIAAKGCVTRHAMELVFGLRRNAALGWLRRLTESGALRKAGTAQSPVYLLPEGSTV